MPALYSMLSCRKVAVRRPPLLSDKRLDPSGVYRIPLQSLTRWAVPPLSSLSALLGG